MKAKESDQEHLDFSLGDRLAQFFIVRKWSPLKTGVIAYLLAWFSSIIIALLSGKLLPGPNYIGLFSDYFYFVTETLTVPIIWGYYVWICQAPTRVLAKLRDSGVLNPTQQNTKSAKKILEIRYPTYIAIVLGFAVGALYFYQGLFAPPQWHTANRLLLGVRSLLVIAPTAYAAWMIVTRLIFHSVVFNQLLKEVVLHPLHPDKSGGLRPLGQYALKTSILIAIGGSLAAYAEYNAYVKGEIATAYFYHIGIALYILLSPISFFAPLWSAHDAMLAAKEELLRQISRQFNSDFTLAYKEINGTPDKLKNNIEKIDQLQQLHQVAESFPVWPFDFITLRRFILTMLSPSLSIIIPITIELLSKILIR